MVYTQNFELPISRPCQNRLNTANNVVKSLLPLPAKELFFPKFKKSSYNFLLLLKFGWSQTLCSIYHNFVKKKYYFDLKFAVFLAITFYYDVLIELFGTMIRVLILILVDHDDVSYL